MTHWRQHAWGNLPDGSRVMIVKVEADDWPRRKIKMRAFEAVLVCRTDGLQHALQSNGRTTVACFGVVGFDDFAQR